MRANSLSSLNYLSNNIPFSYRLSELLELRKLRKSRQGIDIHKLSKGDVKRRKRRNTEEDEHQDAGGLKPGAKMEE